MKSVADYYKEACNIAGKELVDVKLKEFFQRFIKKQRFRSSTSTPKVATSQVSAKVIIEHLNELTGFHYRVSTSTKALIRARLNDGFTFDDFKKVHQIKVKHWLEDVKMRRYLRPKTLYGAKFEDYLVQWQIDEDEKKRKAVNRSSTHTPEVATSQVSIPAKLWNNFKHIEELWRYMAKMTEKQYESYNVPQEVRALQQQYTAMRLNPQKKDRAQYLFNIMRQKYFPSSPISNNSTKVGQ